MRSNGKRSPGSLHDLDHGRTAYDAHTWQENALRSGRVTGLLEEAEFLKVIESGILGRLILGRKERIPGRTEF